MNNRTFEHNNNFSIIPYLMIILCCCYLKMFSQINISGKVTTQDGEPVKNASIWIVNVDNHEEQQNIFTDNLGNYGFALTDLDEDTPLPSVYKLEQNYPNPFTEDTNIPFEAPEDDNVALKIYDILGREVKTLNVNKNFLRSYKSISWDGTNNSGAKVSQGIYLYRLIGKEISLTKKMLYMPGSKVEYSNIRTLPKPNTGVRKIPETKSYEIVVTNTEVTTPLIKPQKAEAMRILSDTSVNFTMERKIDLGYYLYIANVDGEEIYIVDTYTNTIVDSIVGFDCCMKNLILTNNDQKMFTVSTYPLEHTTIYSVDLPTKNIEELEHYDYETDGGYGFRLYKTPEDSIMVIRRKTNPPDYTGYINSISNSTTYFDSLSFSGYTSIDYAKQLFIFDKELPLFYSIDTNLHLFSYNYATKEIIRVYENIYYPGNMVISDTQNHIYVAGGPIFDFEKDSVIAWLGGNERASLALSSNNSKLYITDPGGFYQIHLPPPTGKIYVYDLQKESFSREIDFMKFNYEQFSKVTHSIILFPDDRTAYVSDWHANLYVVDIEINEVVQKIKLPDKVQIIPLNLGKKFD